MKHAKELQNYHKRDRTKLKLSFGSLGTHSERAELSLDHFKFQFAVGKGEVQYICPLN